MRPSKLRIAGIVLLAYSTLLAIGIQVVGPGLMITRPSAAPPQTTATAEGVTITRTIKSTTVFRLKHIVPIVALDILGVLCIILSCRRSTAVSP